MLWGNRPEAGPAYGTNPLSGFSAGAGEYTNVVCAYTGIIDCWQMKKIPVNRRSEFKLRNAIIVKEHEGDDLRFQIEEAQRHHLSIHSRRSVVIT